MSAVGASVALLQRGLGLPLTWRAVAAILLARFGRQWSCEA